MSQIQHNLAPSEQEAICQLVRDNPVDVVCYFMSPEAERMDDEGISYFGVLPHGTSFDVWVHDVEVPLVFEGSFPSYDAAVQCARARAEETRKQALNYLNHQKDEEWAAHLAATIEVSAPFRFWDNNFYRAGWDLETTEDLFAFWHKLFSPQAEPAGNAYEWRLTDADGIDCQVYRSHRGEMRIQTTEDEA